MLLPEQECVSGAPAKLRPQRREFKEQKWHEQWKQLGSLPDYPCVAPPLPEVTRGYDNTMCQWFWRRRPERFASSAPPHVHTPQVWLGGGGSRHHLRPVSPCELPAAQQRRRIQPRPQQQEMRRRRGWYLPHHGAAAGVPLQTSGRLSSYGREDTQ